MSASSKNADTAARKRPPQSAPDFLEVRATREARRRAGAGVGIAAEVVGYGNSFDAYGISEPHPEGRGAYQAMAAALADAGVDAAVVDCINAHGTSTRKNDPVETAAIKRFLGPRAHAVPVCAAKSMSAI